MPNQSEQPDSSEAGSSNEILTICLVEDDKYYAEIVRRLLANRRNPSFVTKHAESLSEARKQLKSSEPDIILLDLNLPDSKGLDTLEAIKDISSAPIIINTSSDDEELGFQAVALGAQDYLVKQHVNKDSLVRSIRYSLERRKAEEAGLRLTAIRDFSAALAHDLKVPLIGARNVVEALLSGHLGELSETQQEAMEVLKESTQNEINLVNRLLQIYKYETESSALPFSKIKVATLLEGVAANDSRATLAIDPSADNILVSGEEEALKTLIFNLLDNAEKFGDEARPIELKAVVENDQVIISVHNWGEIIPSDARKKLFLRFWRGIPGKTYVARTGLGLYLCDRIAQLHQGHMFCESDESGTIFGIKLKVSKSL